MNRFDTAGGLDLSVKNPSGRINVTTYDGTETEIDLEPIGDAQDLVDRTSVTSQKNGGRNMVIVRVPAPPPIHVQPIGVEVRVRAPHDCNLEVDAGSASLAVSGRVGRVRAGMGSGRTDVEVAAGDVSVKSGSGAVHIGSALAEAVVSAGSGSVAVEAANANLDVSTISGRIQVGQVAGDLHATNHSGATEIGRVGGRAEISTDSGKTELDQCAGPVQVRSSSGAVRLGVLRSAVDAHSSSGSIEIGSLEHDSAVVEAISGRVTVGIASGARVEVDAKSISGRITSEIPPSEMDGGESAVRVHARTASGCIRIVRSTASEA